MATTRQLLLGLHFRGGKRKGAGRKPKGKRPLVSHAARPVFARPTPAHVTLGVAEDVPSLRSSKRFTTIRSCFATARGRFGLRLIEFSVLSNHLHLVVEADDDGALSRGMQGLGIRLAKALNRTLGRKGRVFADHYHSRLLRTPTELAIAIRYVLDNAEHHYGEQDQRHSSRSADAAAVLAAPRSWLASIGWRRAPPRFRVAPTAVLAFDGAFNHCEEGGISRGTAARPSLKPSYEEARCPGSAVNAAETEP